MAKRKIPNGLGSIEKVKKQSNGKTRVSQYRARLPAIYDENGKPHRKGIGFFKTYKEAYKALLNYQEPKKTKTFKELYNKFIDTKDFKDKSESTKRRYQTSFKRFKPLHDKDINKIIYTDLQAIIDTMENEGYYKTINGKRTHCQYSKSAINRLKILINQIYTIAIKNNIIDYNLAPYLKIGGVPQKRKKELFTIDEIKKLYKSIPNNKNAMHVLLMIFTGMRTGEYLNLKKDNINLEKNLIYNFGRKTEAGKKRKMIIHPYIKDIVKYLFNNSNSGYIVELNDDKLKDDTMFYKCIYYKALKKADIKKKIPYSCRYTFATLAHQSGVDDKALQSLMGHTDFNITANSYIQDNQDFILNEFKKIKID